MYNVEHEKFISSLSKVFNTLKKQCKDSDVKEPSVVFDSSFSGYAYYYPKSNTVKINPEKIKTLDPIYRSNIVYAAAVRSILSQLFNKRGIQISSSTSILTGAVYLFELMSKESFFDGQEKNQKEIINAGLVQLQKEIDGFPDFLSKLRGAFFDKLALATRDPYRLTEKIREQNPKIFEFLTRLQISKKDMPYFYISISSATALLNGIDHYANYLIPAFQLLTAYRENTGKSLIESIVEYAEKEASKTVSEHIAEALRVNSDDEYVTETKEFIKTLSAYIPKGYTEADVVIFAAAKKLANNPSYFTSAASQQVDPENYSSDISYTLRVVHSSLPLK